MHKIAIVIVCFILITFVSCVTTETIQSQPVTLGEVEDARIFMLVAQEGIGTAFPIGPHKLATASHMCDEIEAPTSPHYDPDLGLISGDRFLGFGRFSLIGIEEALWELYPSYIETNILFSRPYKTGKPKVGMFGKYTTLARGEFNIWILTDSVFVGTPPIPGESGSPILQLNNNEWVAVGVLTHTVSKGGLYAKFRH